MAKRVWFTRCPCHEVFLLHLQEQLGLDRRNQWDFIGIEAIGPIIEPSSVFLEFYVIFGDSIGFILWDFLGFKSI